MTFAGSMTPRRKITTYGKNSRMLISAQSLATEAEFAQDAGSSTLNPNDTSRRWQSGSGISYQSSLYGYSEMKARPEELLRRPMSTKARANGEGRSPSSGSDPAGDVSLYDAPVSDDDLEYNNNEARKKRKISPHKIVPGKYLPMFDDESLQRHVAVEARQDDGLSASRESTLEDGSRESQAVAQWSFDQGMSDFSKKRSLGTERSNIDGKAAEQANGLSFSGKRSENLLQAKAGYHQAQITRTDRTKTIGRPNTPETVLESALLQGDISDTRSFYTSSDVVCQPTRSQKYAGSEGGATTPRQRELWKRLLGHRPQMRSPSSDDLLGLRVSEEMPEELYGRAKRRLVSWEFCRPSATAFKARPPRIVDTLHCSIAGQDHACNNMGEVLGISSSDSKPDYIASEVSAANGDITVQTSPSSNSQGLVNQHQESSSNALHTIPAVYGGPMKITYARQRSYLNDGDLEETAIIGLPVLSESNKRRGYQRRGLVDQVPKSQSVKQYDKEFEDPADSQVGTMRSIHELREAGGNVRLVSELEAILDDIHDNQSGSTSFRLSRLIDLLTKLEEPANCRLLVDQGLESRLMAEVGLDDDLISHSLLVAALLQLMTFSSSAGLLTHFSDVRVVKLFTDQLGSDQDILSYARLRGNKMSMATYADLKNLYSLFLTSTAWIIGKSSMLSCHVLSLQCLEHIVRQTREAGSMHMILSVQAIERVVATSVPPFSTLPPQPDEISIICLELAISILESCTIGNAAGCQASLWESETLERVIGLLPLLALWKGKQRGTSQTLTLRLYLNLTNNSPNLCGDFSTPEVIGAMIRIVISHFGRLTDGKLKADKTLLLDDLILSLGSLINLADLSQIARQLMIDLHYGGRSYLDILLDLFMNKSKNAAEVRGPSATVLLMALI